MASALASAEPKVAAMIATYDTMNREITDLIERRQALRVNLLVALHKADVDGLTAGPLIAFAYHTAKGSRELNVCPAPNNPIELAAMLNRWQSAPPLRAEDRSRELSVA